MSAEQTRAFIRRYFEAINGTEKTPELLQQFVDDPALLQHVAAAEAAFPRYRLEPQDIIVEDDRAAVRFVLRATHRGEFMGIAATGRDVAVDGIIIYRVANDKITDHWLQLDAPALMQQLSGASPAGVA